MMQQAIPERRKRTVEKIGKYDIIKKLGEGATSSVYLGHDTFTDRDVAIKLVSQEALKNAASGSTPTAIKETI